MPPEVKVLCNTLIIFNSFVKNVIYILLFKLAHQVLVYLMIYMCIYLPINVSVSFVILISVHIAYISISFDFLLCMFVSV